MRRSQLGAILPPGDIRQCLEARDAAKLPTRTGQTTTKNCGPLRAVVLTVRNPLGPPAEALPRPKAAEGAGQRGLPVTQRRPCCWGGVLQKALGKPANEGTANIVEISTRPPNGRASGRSPYCFYFCVFHYYIVIFIYYISLYSENTQRARVRTKVIKLLIFSIPTTTKTIKVHYIKQVMEGSGSCGVFPEDAP